MDNGLHSFAYDEDEDDHRLREIGIDTTVDVDHITSPDHTLLIVQTRDRKGLLYDCLRTIKACELRVTNGTLEVKPREDGKEYCHIELFVQDRNKRPLSKSGLGSWADKSSEPDAALVRESFFNIYRRRRIYETHSALLTKTYVFLFTSPTRTGSSSSSGGSSTTPFASF